MPRRPPGAARASPGQPRPPGTTPHDTGAGQNPRRPGPAAPKSWHRGPAPICRKAKATCGNSARWKKYRARPAARRRPDTSPAARVSGVPAASAPGRGPGTMPRHGQRRGRDELAPPQFTGPRFPAGTTAGAECRVSSMGALGRGRPPERKPITPYSREAHITARQPWEEARELLGQIFQPGPAVNSRHYQCRAARPSAGRGITVATGRPEVASAGSTDLPAPVRPGERRVACLAGLALLAP